MAVYGKVLANAVSSHLSFAKINSEAVAFTKTGAFAVSTATQIEMELDNKFYIYPANTVVTMPVSPTIGTDYAVWAKPDGNIEATADHVVPPVDKAKKIGGFHYAPGSNAAAQAGGDDTPQINEYSFWDLTCRPVCPDPRGMVLVANQFWCDIYLTGVNAITNGSSKYNVEIADGSSPPKIPAMFGGDGTATYGSYTWYEANELAAAFGKRCLTNQEFLVAAYGVTEAASRSGSDGVYAPNNTGINTSTSNPTRTGSYYPDQYLTSKWGLIQATGCMWIWGSDRGGLYGTAAWHAVTEGRGSEYNEPYGSLFGGYWSLGTGSGSRCSNWNNAASNSYGSVGSRFACDHLMLVT